MNFLIDTNICIYIINKKPPEVIHRFKNIEVGQIGISTITVSELNYGASKSNLQKQNFKRLEEFLAPFEIIPYSQSAAKYYGEIRSQLENQGNVIGPLDLLIAAHALSEKLTLITNNEKEFKRIKTLKVENWVT
ncbi:MAG: type II toxin-antitoxin system VapC family toxin [Deltaproteobacteria bacterium]|nr:type II toxin-antitoxin system VapC family toxin [Deltaproteobacteria bacterium]MBW2118287.1 type II toxin-antitoxin system VapC family toxin [Deltaproteobacteria bacterium]MBW2342838.1 type II toxin-antitoxin system VapC family toxin [Deltaproteobacteria bacterium]